MRCKSKMAIKSPLLDLQYPRHLLSPAKGVSLALVPCLEASHAVHHPRRIDVRPSVTALVCGPQVLYVMLRSEKSPVGASRGDELSWSTPGSVVCWVEM